jgi:tetratricopeptide (TPR) repeat protein
MLRLRLPALLSVFLFIPSLGHAQFRVSLAGNVYLGDDSHPAGNVTVSLNNTEEGHYEDGMTNGAGQFRFGNLKPSTYVLKIDETGFEPVNKTVDVTLGSDKDLKIYLRSASKNPSAGKSRSISAHELSMPEKARELMETGKRELYQDKNSAAALADFQHAISLAPAYYEAYYHAGMAQLAMANLSEAEKDLRKSTEISGDNYGEADVSLGAILLDHGSASEAEKMIRRGLQLNPNFWLGHYELGRALLNEKRLPEAEDSADQARLLAPTVPIVYRLLSNIHLAQKNYPAMMEDIDAYLALDPSSPAGVRARELREELQRKTEFEHLPPAANKP